MSSKYFRIDEHTVSCQHIRSYPHATLHGDSDVLQLAVKQYTPLSNTRPKPGDVTIIGAHANGFPKELYEPLWDELLALSEQSNFKIRSIWIADVAHQGFSGVLNEGKLGNDPSWHDHPRDLLHMINTFRSEFQQPIIGIGHSLGGNNLTMLSLLHPRLFHSLILMDPVIHRLPSLKGNFAPAGASAFRRDVWPSRSAAAASFKKSKFYQTWDPRVLDSWIKYGLRELPTDLHPEDQTTAAALLGTGSGPKSVIPIASTEPTNTAFPAEKPVTLRTSKHQEVFTFLRPNFPPGTNIPGVLEHSPVTHPDLDLSAGPQTPFYRSESAITFHNLPQLRPSVFYIFGSLSALSAKEFRDEKLAVTGTGFGGSGGVAAGRVSSLVVEGVGHLIPMEAVETTAIACREWMDKELERYREEEKIWADIWARTPEHDKTRVNKTYLEWFDKQRKAMDVDLTQEPAKSASKAKL